MPRPRLTPAKKRVATTITLPPDLMRKIDAMAHREDRPRSKVMEHLMRAGIETGKSKTA